MQWINLLHFYQPANIEAYYIDEALHKSYLRLLRLLEEHPHLKMTWNVSGCLLERLQESQEGQNFIDRLKKIVRSGQVELSSSAAYHGFLPLLPKKEVVLQIKKNEQILKDVLGIKKRPQGFFLPEMAYSPNLAKIIYELGYKWIMVDEVAAYKYALKDKDIVFKDKASKLKVLLRNRTISNSYPPLSLPIELDKNNTSTFITATDAELYGLRHEDPNAEMENLAKNKKIKTKTISDFLRELKINNLAKKELKLVASSWETQVKDIEKKQAFVLWDDKKNKIHQELWSLAKLAMSLDKEFKKDKNYQWYRWHLVRGLASCTFWWASAHDFKKVFGPLAWSPDIIERGLEDMVRSVRSLDGIKSKKYKLKAENYYLKIKKLIWEDHWTKHWQR